jgi:hypothetical protein
MTTRINKPSTLQTPADGLSGSPATRARELQTVRGAFWRWDSGGPMHREADGSGKKRVSRPRASGGVLATSRAPPAYNEGSELGMWRLGRHFFGPHLPGERHRGHGYGDQLPGRDAHKRAARRGVKRPTRRGMNAEGRAEFRHIAGRHVGDRDQRVRSQTSVDDRHLLARGPFGRSAPWAKAAQWAARAAISSTSPRRQSSGATRRHSSVASSRS